MMIDVRGAPAGIAIEVACAKAMGREITTRPGRFAWSGPEYRTRIVPWGRAALLSQYSRYIRDAWKLVEAMRYTGYWVTIHTMAAGALPEPVVGVQIGTDDSIMHLATAETAPLAICRAFLLAHGITELEVTGETLGLD